MNSFRKCISILVGLGLFLGMSLVQANDAKQSNVQYLNITDCGFSNLDVLDFSSSTKSKKLIGNIFKPPVIINGSCDDNDDCTSPQTCSGGTCS
ncbi:hypothetical protein QUF74_02980 [Candidatus Halobeggiatoa sp. HSG11]|nr:hypothetical protein [Candidatus Halobeggiatoa sp. HSG11]